MQGSRTLAGVLFVTVSSDLLDLAQKYNKKTAQKGGKTEFIARN